MQFLQIRTHVKMGSQISKRVKKPFILKSGNEIVAKVDTTDQADPDPVDKVIDSSQNTRDVASGSLVCLKDANTTLTPLLEKLVSSREDEGKASEEGVTFEALSEESLSEESDSFRPYGLPAEMEEIRKSIWKLIVVHVNDLDSIVHLREACTLFKDLLEMKYVALMLPQVIWIHFVNERITLNAENRKDWLMTLTGLRILSNASKKSVDLLLDRYIVGKDETEWFSIREEIPILNGAALVPRLKENKVFGVPGKEVIPANNPAFQQVVMCSESNSPAVDVVEVALQLFKFYAACIPRNPSFQQLKTPTLALWNPNDSLQSRVSDIRSEDLFNFLSSIESDENGKDLLKIKTLARPSPPSPPKSKETLLDIDMLIDPFINEIDLPSINQHHNLIGKTIPILHLGASGIWGLRVKEALAELKTENPEDSFPLKAFILDEISDAHDNVAVDVPHLRNSFETMIATVGMKITCFIYRTEEKSYETYANLRKWVTFMPNLQDLVVELRGRNPLELWERTGLITVKSFPTCPCLKRYAEGPNGFGVPFLKEIIRANPTIQEVILGKTPPSEWNTLRAMLDTVKLTKLFMICPPREPFFKQPFQWATQLTTLAISDPNDRWKRKEFPIRTDALFELLSSMENLVDLMVSTVRIWDKGGFAELPKLRYLTWKVLPTCQTLLFCIAADKLEYMTLDLSKYPEFVEEWSIPSLYPSLKRIRARTEDGGAYKTVWTRGTD